MGWKVKHKIILAVIVANVLFLAQAHAQILIDEGWGSATKLKNTTPSFSEGYGLRAKKRVGLGASFAGAVGLGGVNLNLNFTPEYTFILGVGLSHDFQTLNVGLKKYLGGRTVQPYAVAGYTNWHAEGESRNLEKTSPALLSNRFLSRHERETGRFSENIVYPGLGLEYTTVEGPYQGLSFYAEAMWLVDLDDIAMGATGGIGSIYYF